MIQKGLAIVAALLFLVPSNPVASGQSNPAAITPATGAAAPGNAQAAPASHQAAPATETGAPAASPALPAARTDCFGGNCDYQPPHITIATPAPAPAPWPWQERIAWSARIVLVALAYAAILLALSLLRKIERQTRYTEIAAQAAQESAQAALAHSQALARAERPWLLMSVRPSRTTEDGFSVIATNRGRGPARILSTVDEIVSAVDEAHLAATPVYRRPPVAPADPIILLHGENTEIFSFSRADLQRICDTEERLARVEKWEEKIFLYGEVSYRDLAAPDDAPAHQSSWLCWYIHGRHKSGMVMSGPPAYNRHT